MKQFLLALLLVFTVTGIAHAAAPKADEKAVAKAVEFMRQAMISGNKADLMKVALPGLVYIHSAGAAENRDEFVNSLATRKSHFTAITLTEQKITVAGNVAVVQHIFDGTLDPGKPRTVYLRIMLVFKKTKGEWKLLARQAAKADRPK